MPSALPPVEGVICPLAVETPDLTAVPNCDLAEVCSTLSSSPLTTQLHYSSVTSCFSFHYLPAFCISLNVFTVWTTKDLTLLWSKSTQCQISATPGTNKKHMSGRQPSILTWWHVDFSLTVWRNMFNMWDRSCKDFQNSWTTHQMRINQSTLHLGFLHFCPHVQLITPNTSINCWGEWFWF